MWNQLIGAQGVFNFMDHSKKDILKDHPSVVTAPEAFPYLTKDQVVVLNGDIGPLNFDQEEALCHFVEHGGGLVCLGDAAEAYHEQPLLGELLGNVHGFCTPSTEIIAR